MLAMLAGGLPGLRMPVASFVAIPVMARARPGMPGLTGLAARAAADLSVLAMLADGSVLEIQA